MSYLRNHKKKALNENRDISTQQNNWYECIYHDWTEKIESAYFNVQKIYFTGFGSQGDGVCFVYDSVKPELYDEFLNTMNLSKKRKESMLGLLSFSLNGTHSGRYYHSKSISHNCKHIIYASSSKQPALYKELNEIIKKFNHFAIEKYEELCFGLYKELESEYDYITSDDYIAEHFNANDYLFTEDGSVYIQ